MKNQINNSINIIGHRGLGSDKYNVKYNPLAPRENTLVSFLNAISSGTHGIETDLRRLKSGETVCFHDRDFNGRRLNTYTLEEIRKLFPALLTLDDLIEANLKSHFIFELKSGEANGDIIQEVRSKIPTQEERNFSWISFDYNALDLAQGDNLIWIPTCVPHKHMMPFRFHPYISLWDLELADSLGIYQIAAHPLALTKNITHLAQQNFALQLGAQVNDQHTLERMVSRGITYVYTDNLPLISNILSLQ